jgi:hypothetical protein
MIKYILVLSKIYFFMWITILIIVVWLIIIYNVFVYNYSLRLVEMEAYIMNVSKKRSAEVVWIYQTAKDDLMKEDQVFEGFFNLKKRDFQWDCISQSLEEKLNIYKRIQDEIDFIFTICEKHIKIIENPFYTYFKESVLKKTKLLNKDIKKYEKVKEKFLTHKNIANFTLIWYLY